jgi:hypothetical protein
MTSDSIVAQGSRALAYGPSERRLSQASPVDIDEAVWTQGFFAFWLCTPEEVDAPQLHYGRISTKQSDPLQQFTICIARYSGLARMSASAR